LKARDWDARHYLTPDFTRRVFVGDQVDIQQSSADQIREVGNRDLGESLRYAVGKIATG
jgi:hypothetical protein